jgi:Glu-tRNA(Gln) amidotransferase subunit E-like FAD-binding protein
MAEDQTSYGWNPDMPVALQEKLKEDLKMQAMGTIMKHFDRTADGELVNEILKEWK